MFYTENFHCTLCSKEFAAVLYEKEAEQEKKSLRCPHCKELISVE